MFAAETITGRLRREIVRHLPRRIDLGPEDSAAMRDKITLVNARFDQESLDDFRIPENGPYTFRRIPLRLDQPETRFVRWDDYEQLQVLSATCFTPEPK